MPSNSPDSLERRTTVTVDLSGAQLNNVSFSLLGDEGLKLLGQFSKDTNYELLSIAVVFALRTAVDEDKQIIDTNQPTAEEELHRPIITESALSEALQKAGSRQPGRAIKLLKKIRALTEDRVFGAILQPEAIKLIISSETLADFKDVVAYSKFGAPDTLGDTSYAYLRTAALTLIGRTSDISTSFSFTSEGITAATLEEISESALHSQFWQLVRANTNLLANIFEKDEIVKAFDFSRIPSSTRHRNLILGSGYFDDQNNSGLVVRLLAETSSVADFKKLLEDEKPAGSRISTDLLGPIGYILLKRVIYHILSQKTDKT